MQGKKNEQKAWRQTLIVDKKQIQSMGKDILKMFPFSLTNAPYSEKISKILSEVEQSQIKINKEEYITFQKLGQIGKQISSLKNILKNYDQSNEYLLKVQNTSEDILAKLQNFRGKMAISYQELADAQETLNNQIQFLSQKIQGRHKGQELQQKENLKTYNRDQKIIKKQKPLIDQEIVNSKGILLQKKMKEKEIEVSNVQKAINSMGKNLGWPDQDHADFISIWHRGPHKNYFQIQEEMQSYFGFYTGEQIQEHMNKYIKLKKLNQEKKQLIIQYKNLKEAKKMEDLKELQLQRQRQKEQIEKRQLKKMSQKEQVEMKAKVIEWKQAKQRQKQQQQQLKQRQKMMKIKQEEAKRRQKQEKNRDALQKWKQQQQQKKKAIRRVQSARKKVDIDPEAEERIRLREQLLLQKRLEIVNDKKREEQIQKAKQEKIKQQKFVKFSHVTNKLEKKTTAMKQKERQKFDGKEKKQAHTFGGQLMMTGVRATPSWMK